METWTQAFSLTHPWSDHLIYSLGQVNVIHVMWVSIASKFYEAYHREFLDWRLGQYINGINPIDSLENTSPPPWPTIKLFLFFFQGRDIPSDKRASHLTTVARNWPLAAAEYRGGVSYGVDCSSGYADEAQIEVLWWSVEVEHPGTLNRVLYD